MSPLLFLLIVEGLNKLLHNDKEEGKSAGLKIYMVLRITHVLFVDDILIFGK